MSSSSRRLRINTDVLRETYARLDGPRGLRQIGVKEFSSIRRMTWGVWSEISGGVVRLEVAYDKGGRLMTSMEAYHRFLQRINGLLPNDDPGAPLAVPRKPSSPRKRKSKPKPKKRAAVQKDIAGDVPVAVASVPQHSEWDGAARPW